jgi:hypothetical protein
VVKVVMTGSADDGPDWQPHIRNKDKRRKLANRFKDAKDPFRIVIVRDMWLTGFDAPCLHTMYADKPMQGHGLMQAIARVNRVFRDKPGGLVVDYLGLADQLKKALITYTESGGQGDPTFDTAQAIAVMLEKHGIACDMMHGFNWDKWTTGKPTERLALIPAGQEHILEQEDGKKRWVQVVTELSRAFALCAASDEATDIRDDVSFFQALQAALNKQSSQNRKTPEQIDAAIRQLVSKAIMLIGSMLTLGAAMDHTGAAAYLAGQIVALVGGAGPLWLLSGFFALTVLLTQPMSNQAAAIVIIPIAIKTAVLSGLDPRPFAIMIAVAASCSYLTPLEPSCLMVYGPGRYRFSDFVKVGSLLTVLIYLIAITLVPLVWPLR